MKIKFISLNIFKGGVFFDKILKFLEKEKPDIVAFQEVYDGKNLNLPKNLRSIEVLKKNFQGWDYHFAPEFLAIREEGKIEIGNAIFSKFPIKNKSITELNTPYGEFQAIAANGDYSHHPKNIHWCEIEIDQQLYNFYNLHGIWGYDSTDTKARLKMSDIILDQARDKKRVILAGDFNIVPSSKTIRKIEQHLNNVFKDELTTSFNLKRKDLVKSPGYATSVVDMIFVSDDIKVVDHYCPQVDVSDHLPLVCEFET